MFFLVGIGLGSEKDITLRGLEIVKLCSKVYLESYTSILGIDHKKLEALYQREIIIADRDMMEIGIDDIIGEALDSDVCILVVGDVYSATTHMDMTVRAKKRGIKVACVHNASIMNAVAACGLSLYRFGETVSIPYFDGKWRPYSFYDKIVRNKRAGLHTLCLLDIKVKERSLKNIMLERDIFEPPRFMSVGESIDQILEAALNSVKKSSDDDYDSDQPESKLPETETQSTSSNSENNPETPLITSMTLGIGLARVGQEDQYLAQGTLTDLREQTEKFGTPLHSLVIPGDIEPFETEILDYILVNLSKKSTPGATTGTGTMTTDSTTN